VVNIRILNAIFYGCIVLALALILFDGDESPAPVTRYACPTEFSAKALYVAPEGEGYVETGGTSDDPAVANAYDFGILYGRCQK